MILQTILCVEVHLLSYMTPLLVGIVGPSVLATDCDCSWLVYPFPTYIAVGGQLFADAWVNNGAFFFFFDVAAEAMIWRSGACLQIMIVTSSKYH